MKLLMLFANTLVGYHSGSARKTGGKVKLSTKASRGQQLRSSDEVNQDQSLTISVITPSYMQGGFLEATINSVVSQNSACIEYLIMDGASTDGCVDIIQEYSDHLAYWVSEPDNGQAHAINKGFAKSTGDILCWVNSDDLLAPNALRIVRDYFAANPASAWCTGLCQIIDSQGVPGKVLEADTERPLSDWLTHIQRNQAAILQPSTFWRREAWETVGPLREDLHYAFDFEFFYRLRERFGPPGQLKSVLSRFRIHDASKTVSTREMFLIEMMEIAREHRQRLCKEDRSIVDGWLDSERGLECFLRQQRAIKHGDPLGHWHWRLRGWVHRAAQTLADKRP